MENKDKNRAKLKIIPISRRKTSDVITPDEEFYEYVGEGKVLSLNTTSTGYSKHIKERISKATIELKKIKRFRNINLKNKRKLYLALIRPILTYPIIPTVSASKSLLKKMQRVQNEALRWMTHTYLRTRNNQELHTRIKIEPINIYFNNQDDKIWNRLREEITKKEFTNVTEVNETYVENTRFRRSYSVINESITPIYH